MMSPLSEIEIQEIVERVQAGLRASGQPETAAIPEHTQRGKIALGADHGGFSLKENIKNHLETQGYSVIDCGTHSAEAVDYPDFAEAVARTVASREAYCGIMVDGAGIGSCMAANKVRGVRAAMCYDHASAINSREHNFANVLTLGAGMIGMQLAIQIVDAWLNTAIGSERHAKRVQKIMAIEARS
jgi:ribose 5-phosphate isomerase B